MKSFNESSLLERCNQDFTITESTYSVGILDVIDFLVTEMTSLLQEENRYYGVVRSYIKTIYSSYEKIYPDMTEEDIDIYGKILFLFKPSIKREYRWLINTKRLSPADADIVIVRKMLEIVAETPEFKYKSEVKTIRKVIGNLFDNIRNKGKEAGLREFSDNLRKFKQSGIIGKYCLDRFSFQENMEKKPVSGSNVKVKADSDEKIIEVSLE